MRPPAVVQRPGYVAGKPHLAGHRMTVQQVAVLTERGRLSAEAIAAQYGLRPMDVETALAYFNQNRAAVEQALRDDEDFIRGLQKRIPSRLREAPLDKPMEFYLDESVSRLVRDGLAALGLAVLTAAEARMLGTPDDQHLAFAGSVQRVLFTQDVSCLRLHAGGLWHKGLIYAAPDLPPDRIVRALLHLRTQLGVEDMAGHVEFIGLAEQRA